MRVVSGVAIRVGRRLAVKRGRGADSRQGIQFGTYQLVAIVLALLCPAPASAQLFEAVGTRAQGMGGAFVAVADDATANWWNPAGLATGAYFNVVLERGRTTEPADPDPTAQASRLTTSGFSAAFPALGLSYYRLRTSEIGAVRPETGELDLEVGRTGRSIRYSQYSSTVGQSIGDHLVIGSTLKLLRAGTTGPINAEGASLGDIDDLSVPVRTRVGLDVGAMASFRWVRLGLAVRNLRQPNIGSDEAPFKLRRQARAGVAVFGAKRGLLDGFSVSADADLTRTDTLFGEVRHAAGGGEAWLFARHLGLRGGVSVNSIGDLRAVASVGASIAPVSGFFVDAAWSKGRDQSLEGWTTSLRFTF